MATNVYTSPLVVSILLGTLSFLKTSFHFLNILPHCPHKQPLHLDSPVLYLGRIHCSTHSPDQDQHPLLQYHIHGPHLHTIPSPSLSPVTTHSPNPLLPIIPTRIQHLSSTPHLLQLQKLPQLQKIPHLQKWLLTLFSLILLLTP